MIAKGVINLHYQSGIECYNKLDKGRYPILVGEDIKGDTIETLDEWNTHPYKHEIMLDAMKFKEYLRSLNEIEGFFNRIFNTPPFDIGRIGNVNRTPILEVDHSCNNIESYIRNFDSSINKCNKLGAKVSPCLVQTDLGRRILNDLNNTEFSDNVFCHNALYYKSFVLKNNKLIGIKNWQYSGFYPPELEDIIQCYISYII